MNKKIFDQILLFLGLGPVELKHILLSALIMLKLGVPFANHELWLEIYVNPWI